MSEFRTTITNTNQKADVGLAKSIFTLGSCFADGIGTLLKNHKINTLVNPFGSVYNPHSIHKLLQYAIHNNHIAPDTYLHHHDISLNYDFHSQFSAIHYGELSDKLSSTVTSAHHFLKHADVIMITYGTSWVYNRNDTGEIVANCHKVPAAGFTKSLLPVEKITASFERVYRDLKTLNPELKIILTVSPVRHTKDTLELNSVSKSILRIACHALSTTFADVDYFPAYEIMIDDLRDYRFYKADLIHPSDVAEDYIWQKFIDQYADHPFKKFLPEWQTVTASLSHKPFHPESVAHQHFLKELLKKLEALKPFVNVDFEINLVKSKIIS